MKATNRTLLIILTALILVILISPVLMGSGMMGSGMMGVLGQNNWSQLSGWSWGLMMALGSLRLIALWAALIIGIVLVLRLLRDSSVGLPGSLPDAALDILRQRYAAGEITQTEYEQIRLEVAQ